MLEMPPSLVKTSHRVGNFLIDSGEPRLSRNHLEIVSLSRASSIPKSLLTITTTNYD